MDNQDILLKFMIIMYKINNCWQKKIYGTFLKKCRDNKKIFNIKYVTLKSIKNKKYLYDLWKEIFDKFNDKETTIGQLIDLMDSKNLLEKSFIETIKAENIYSKVFDVSVCEVISLENSNENPNISTQHGVKGESYDSVVFVAEDSKKNNPRIYMYDFFKVWAKVNFSLDEFEDFYFKYFEFIKKIHFINKDKEYLIAKSNEIIREFDSNKIFNILCKDIYKDYIKRPSNKNADRLFKDNTVRGVLSAYKLFYVGCSRARKNLTVLVNIDNIVNFNEVFRNKIEKVGFKIINPSDI